MAQRDQLPHQRKKKIQGSQWLRSIENLKLGMIHNRSSAPLWAHSKEKSTGFVLELTDLAALTLALTSDLIMLVCHLYMNNRH
mmetsp:Transcript_29655/g.63874  ORF Transcript_29655/g.63874 Transcript_29655/m.63874 type:complete len:83 (+) Transcript_29655:159-407(+)